MMAGQTDRQTDIQTDRRTDGQDDYYRAPPRASGGALMSLQVREVNIFSRC